MTDAFVKVCYSCPLCGIKEREVSVPARGDEDVVRWMENTCMMALGRDHATISPGCHPTHLREILIPVSGSDKIGGVIRQ